MKKVFSKLRYCHESSIFRQPPAETTQRENMATWFRRNIAVTDVYEIVDTIGNGRMGEVYHVRRKEGNKTHTIESKKKEEYEISKKSYSSKGKKHDSNDVAVSHAANKTKTKSPLSEIKTLKPNSILRKSKHGIDNSQHSEQQSPSQNEMPSNGISDKVLRTLKIDDDDDSDNDDGNSMTVNSITNSEDESHEHMLLNQKEEPNVEEKIEVVHHPKFCTPEQDDSSIISDIEIKFNPSETNDNGMIEEASKTENKINPKKWVPRRRVFFRRHYACKTIATENIKKAEMKEELLNEIHMMRKIDHPYIIRLYEVYQVERKFILIICDYTFLCCAF